MSTRTTTFIVLALLCTTTLGCAIKSVFPIAGDQQNNGTVFQYCGGQVWGYVKELTSEKTSPYLAVYLESDVSEKSDVIVLNFAIQAKSSVEFSSPTTGLQIQLDGHEVFNKPSHFGILKDEKQIWDRYPRAYVYNRISNTENNWEVRKEKYDGLFGQLALEEPFIVKIPKHPFEEIKTTSTKINYDIDLDAIYIISKVIVPFNNAKSKTTEISAQIPSFKLNGTTIPESNYTFNYNREQLIQRTKGAYRCASLEEIFRDARNKTSWIWWMYPEIEN